jgi:hypothetical protein
VKLTVTCVDSGDKALKYLGLNNIDEQLNDNNSSSTKSVFPQPLQLQEVI